MHLHFHCKQHTNQEHQSLTQPQPQPQFKSQHISLQEPNSQAN